MILWLSTGSETGIPGLCSVVFLESKCSWKVWQRQRSPWPRLCVSASLVTSPYYTVFLFPPLQYFISSEWTFLYELILCPFEARSEKTQVYKYCKSKLSNIYNEQRWLPRCQETPKQINPYCSQQSMRNVKVTFTYDKPKPNSLKWASKTMS